MRDEEITTDPGASNPERPVPPRGPIHWISRVIAGALGILMIVVGVHDLMVGIRGPGIRGVLVGLLLAYYGFTGGRRRSRRTPATTRIPEGDRPPKPIE